MQMMLDAYPDPSEVADEEYPIGEIFPDKLMSKGNRERICVLYYARQLLCDASYDKKNKVNLLDHEAINEGRYDKVYTTILLPYRDRSVL